ncbi:MAG: diguanylate cyclase [Eubacterium sp.]|nr:diguanylate cyclase [Eubacterium sp.]
MTDQNCEMLFEYLKSILYDDVIQPFDVNALDEPFRKLGLGLHVLQRSVEEMKTYSKDLSCGNLSGQFPSRDNFLCVNLKNLHANLNHLTWQAKQVAAGDYSQHVSYLGEFSDAFNLMTKQLQEREIYLARMAFWDQLTEIRNRRFFMEYMDNFLKKKKQATLCYMDLDGLKYVNDFYGHLEGDEYIRSFVNAVQENLENVSLFARLGGDYRGRRNPD